MTKKSTEELRREQEVIDHLRYTKEQLELRARIIQEMPTDDLAKLSDEELLALTERLFGNKK